MASRKKRNRKVLEDEKVQQRTKSFLSNAEGIIHKMLELNNSRQDEAKHLVDEIIHSIFFLGRINKPPLSPAEIFTDSEYLGVLRHCYPLPFALYSSQLPRRTPFSCVLDMIVLLDGKKNENEIKQKLQEIIRELHLKESEPLNKKKRESEPLNKKKRESEPLNQNERESEPLISSTICVSQKNPNSEKYYGVSMSTSGRDPGRIMVAASCLSGYWDSYVAGAVMSFNPKKDMKSYFDGTIKLLKPATCQAFSLLREGAQEGEEESMDPCQACVNLFGLEGGGKTVYPYGNCAEVESVSNLFKNDTGVRERARPTSEKSTTENRKKAEKSFRDGLRNLLKRFKVPCDYTFYIPSE